MRQKDEYRLDEQIGYLLRLASQRHVVIFQNCISEDLTPMQFSALVRLAEHGTVSQNQLGRLAAMDIATIKGVVDRLRIKKLLRANPDPQDKRRSLLSLTKKGEKLIEQLRLDGESISRETLSALKASEQRTLLTLLQKISF